MKPHTTRELECCSPQSLVQEIFADVMRSWDMGMHTSAVRALQEVAENIIVCVRPSWYLPTYLCAGYVVTIKCQCANL